MTPSLEALWQAMPAAILTVDAEDRITLANSAAEDVFAASARSLQGADLARILLLDAPLAQATARVRATNAPLLISSVALNTPQGPTEPTHVQIAPLDTPKGALLLSFAPTAPSARSEQGRGVTSAAKSAIGMAEMLAHEIKNPLAGISGAAQLLDMSLDAEGRELTGLIVAETKRIVALLDQVEGFGNTQAPACQPVNIHDVLERARRSAELGFATHMQITENYDPSLPPVWGDPDQLLQVALNLIKNAAEAGQPGGQITLRTFFEPGLRLLRADGSRGALPLQVEVIDDGPGLPPDLADHIFDPFVSGRENGTGLGLALVAKIVADHEGRIGVTSAPGRTVFRLSLPLAP